MAFALLQVLFLLEVSVLDSGRGILREWQLDKAACPELTPCRGRPEGVQN